MTVEQQRELDERLGIGDSEESRRERVAIVRELGALGGQ